MAQVIWTETALQYLDQIADYISLGNPKVAKKLVRNCFRHIKDLKQHPRLGKGVEELDQSIYRELVLPPCRLFYRIDENSPKKKSPIHNIYAWGFC